MVYRHRATRSLRARARRILLRIRPAKADPFGDHRLSAEVGGIRVHDKSLLPLKINDRVSIRRSHLAPLERRGPPRGTAPLNREPL